MCETSQICSLFLLLSAWSVSLHTICKVLRREIKPQSAIWKFCDFVVEALSTVAIIIGLPFILASILNGRLLDALVIIGVIFILMSLGAEPDCITGLSPTGHCGAAHCCNQPYDCCKDCPESCNGRCGWIEKGEK